MPGVDITIGQDSAVMVGGLFDGLVNRIMGSIKFDWHKLDPDLLKTAVRAICGGVNGFIAGVGGSLKKAITAPLDADDVAIQKAIDLEVSGMAMLEASAIAEIDHLFPAGGGFSAQDDLSTADVDNYLSLVTAREKDDGRNAPVFNGISVIKLKANPNAVRILKRMPQWYQMKALSDSSVMQKVIDFLFKYGPYLAQILSMLLLFI